MRVLDPTHEQVAETSEPAPRRSSLEGAVIGVISNGKEGTRRFFELLEQQLREQHGIARLEQRVKSSYSAPADSEILAEVQRWHAVVAGVGD